MFPYTGPKHIIISISVRFSTVDKKLVDHDGIMNMNFNFTFKQTSSTVANDFLQPKNEASLI